MMTDKNRATAGSGVIARIQSTLRHILQRKISESLILYWNRYIHQYQEYFIFIRRFKTGTENPAHSPFTVRCATWEDPDTLRVFEPYKFVDEFCSALKHHNWVILALKGDEPVGFYLLADHPGPELPFGAIPIGDGQVWAVDLYVRPEFRSCYVGRMMQIYRDHLLLSEGYREHVSTVRKENLASLRLVNSMKPETIKYLTFRRLFWKTYIRIDEDAREEFEERMSADKKQLKSKKEHMGQAGVP